MQLREQWLWNKGIVRLYMALSTLSAIALSAGLYSEYGLTSAYLLLLIPVSFVPYFIYMAVGEKVAILLGCKSAQNGEAVESLLVIDNKKSPGIAILRSDVLILIPVTGRRRKYKLTKILSVKKNRWLAGRFLWGKLAFHLQTSTTTTIAFAISESVGKRWGNQLTKQGCRG